MSNVDKHRTLNAIGASGRIDAYAFEGSAHGTVVLTPSSPSTGQTGQFEAFDDAFQTAMNVPSSRIPPPPPNEIGEDGKPKRGRPRKTQD